VAASFVPKTLCYRNPGSTRQRASRDQRWPAADGPVSTHQSTSTPAPRCASINGRGCRHSPRAGAPLTFGYGASRPQAHTRGGRTRPRCPAVSATVELGHRRWPSPANRPAHATGGARIGQRPGPPARRARAHGSAPEPGHGPGTAPRRSATCQSSSQDRRKPQTVDEFAHHFFIAVVEEQPSSASTKYTTTPGPAADVRRRSVRPVSGQPPLVDQDSPVHQPGQAPPRPIRSVNRSFRDPRSPPVILSATKP